MNRRVSRDGKTIPCQGDGNTPAESDRMRGGPCAGGEFPWSSADTVPVVVHRFWSHVVVAQPRHA
jgi:hypothetical protein